MTTVSQWKYGVFVPGEYHAEIFPKYAPSVPLPGVLHVHGAGGTGITALSFYGDGDPHATNEFANAGFVSVSPDLGGKQTWGNSSITDKMTSAYNYLQMQPGVKPGRIVLYAQSAGGLAALNWAAANPDKVSCISLIIPVVNLTDIKVNDRTGYASYVDAAYGGNYSEAVYGTTRNPITQAQNGKYLGIPMQIHYGLTDTTCVPGETERFAGIVGADVVSYPTGHEMATYEAVNNKALVDWVIHHMR